MAAPNTSSYVLVSPDDSELPNSRVLLASGGIVLQDTGASGDITVNTVGNLANLNLVSGGGYINYNAAGHTFDSHTLTAANGINITNPNGQDGPATFSVVDNTTIQRVNAQASGIGSGQATDTLNFIPGGGTSITAGFNPITAATDITIFSTGSLAPHDARYIIQTTNPELPNAQALSSLSTGILKSTTATGVLSIAIPNVDYTPYNSILESIVTAGTPPRGTLLVGNSGGTGYTAVGLGGSGTVLTSNGTTATWAAVPPAPPMEVIILGTGVSSVLLVANKHYVATNPSVPVIFSLPSAPTPGDKYKVSGNGPMGYAIYQNTSNNSTAFLSQVTTTSDAGRIESLGGDNTYNTIEIMCVADIFSVAPIQFTVTASMGNFVIV